MSKKLVSLSRLKQQRKNIRFEELKRILIERGYREQSAKGSHFIFGKEKNLPIMIVKPHGNKKFCHPLDVTKVIRLLEKAEDE